MSRFWVSLCHTVKALFDQSKKKEQKVSKSVLERVISSTYEYNDTAAPSVSRLTECQSYGPRSSAPSLFHFRDACILLACQSTNVPLFRMAMTVFFSLHLILFSGLPLSTKRKCDWFANDSLTR